MRVFFMMTSRLHKANFAVFNHVFQGKIHCCIVSNSLHSPYVQTKKDEWIFSGADNTLSLKWGKST